MVNSAVGSHILVLEDNKYRKTISLEESTYSIGRHKINTIVIDSKQASRKHATLMRRFNTKTNSHSYWLLDGDLEGNKSVNGVFVNGEKCLVKELKNGDLINFGCNVNASYHCTSSWSDTFVNLEQVRSGATIPQKHQLGEVGVAKAFKTNFGNNVTYTETHHEKTNSKQTIQEQSFRDPLTELPNRVLFNEHLTIALSNAKRNQNLIGIVLLDINDFKYINDNFGYPVGDRLLKFYAERLDSCFRSGDIVARWGGDEFAILLPRISNVEDVSQIAQRILKVLKQPFEVAGQSIQLTTQFGIALYPQDGKDANFLVQQAADNLCQNQVQKDNKSTVIGVKVDAKDERLSKAKNVLLQALQQEEFALYYQPQINTTSGEVQGIEALLRWTHPCFGAVAPSKFIPLAEETDLIIPIGQWVLKTACEQNQAWQKLGLPPLPISVNLSPRQLQHPEIVQMVRQVLDETGLEPRWLELEITESALMQDLEVAAKVLTQLQRLGVKLSMDDFGIGCSSLGYLKQFPFHTLKIAQSFIKQLKENSQDVVMLSALIALGQGLNLRVVAEGVETQQQVELLRSLQCEQMQGYLFSHPLQADDVARYLGKMHSIFGQN